MSKDIIIGVYFVSNGLSKCLSHKLVSEPVITILKPLLICTFEAKFGSMAERSIAQAFTPTVWQYKIYLFFPIIHMLPVGANHISIS